MSWFNKVANTLKAEATAEAFSNPPNDDVRFSLFPSSPLFFRAPAPTTTPPHAHTKESLHFADKNSTACIDSSSGRRMCGRWRTL